MIKKYTLLLISALCFTSAFSQNDIKVQDIISPSARTYNTVDTFDIIIRIQNLGPNRLIPGDKFDITYSIEDGTLNSQFFDTLLLVNGSRAMEVGEGRIYTLATDFIINGNNTFAACADVSGTTIYTQNTNKNPGDCATFIVSVEQQQLDIEKLYFADNAIHLSLNRADKVKLEIFDITGKLILESNVPSKSNNIIPFNAPSNGFYFIKLTTNNGAQTSSKFVVN
ncbi:MAG: T9SS type A sorting domain-containing protein [Flavobacteriales bacterium]|nr:T9SS type A sorting domain-containing protein [Flavobacteriales bacterium]